MRVACSDMCTNFVLQRYSGREGGRWQYRYAATTRQRPEAFFVAHSASVAVDQHQLVTLHVITGHRVCTVSTLGTLLSQRTECVWYARQDPCQIGHRGVPAVPLPRRPAFQAYETFERPPISGMPVKAGRINSSCIRCITIARGFEQKCVRPQTCTMPASLLFAPNEGPVRLPDPDKSTSAFAQ